MFEGKEEEALYEAYKLGKQCFEARISIEEITNLHTQSLENILKTIPSHEVHDIVLKSSNLLIEFSIQFGLVCQNYFETLQRTDERIRNALYQAGESLTAGLDIQKMLLVVLNLVKNLTDAAGCAIVLFDEEKVIKASEGLDAEEDFFKHALFEQVAKEGKAGFIYDLKEEKAKITLKDGRELRSILAMPVNFKGKTMGVLGICLTQPHRYEEEEINLLTSFARQAGIAIENTHLFSELQRRIKTIECLYDIDRVVSKSLVLEETLKSALTKAIEVIGADSGSIHLLDEKGDLMLKIQKGLSQEFANAINKIKMGDGITGNAAKMQKPETLDIARYPSYELLPHLKKEGIVSLASTPLIAKGKVLGAMTFSNRKQRIFSKDDLDLLVSIGSQIGVAIENARLFSELQRHDKTLEALYAIDRVVSQTLELESLFKNALSKALEVTETEAGGIYLLEEDGETLSLKNHSGLSSELASAFSKLKVGQGVSGMAVKLEKPVAMDIAGYPSPEMLAPLIKDGIVFIASAPLIAKGKVLGAITLADRGYRSFSPEYLDLLASIGSQIGVAIQNAKLFSELERSHKTLKALYAIESVVSRSLNLEEIFNVALSKALEVTDSETGTLYSLDGEVLRLKAIAGLSPEFKEKAIIRKMGEGIPGIAAQSKKPVTMDISQFPSPTLLPYVKKEGLVSFIGTPLMSKGKVVGALALGTKKKRIFTQDDLDLMLSIGNVIGIAIENAQLYKEVKDKAEHIGILYRITRAVKASLDVNEVFNVMVGEMRNILSFDRISISLSRE
ncbi:MAG: GAF domain-containing protein, partial [Candidatus Methanoperedens sp.]|nr:GAF domain-containing protein [Candidatus Methanoperedens sp.]